MNFIPCTIETIRAEGEDCWEISVPSVYASEAALEFAALHLNRREKIVFSDKTNCFTIFSDAVTLGNRTVSVEQCWLDAVWCLFLDTHRNGWSHTAHIDQDFSDKSKELCITIRLTPPF